VSGAGVVKKYFFVRITKCACQTIFWLYKNDLRFIDREREGGYK